MHCICLQKRQNAGVHMRKMQLRAAYGARMMKEGAFSLLQSLQKIPGLILFFSGGSSFFSFVSIKDPSYLAEMAAAKEQCLSVLCGS